MHILARIIKFLFYVPIVILVFPALLLLTISILLVETDEGPLRTFFFEDVNRLGFRKGFSLFMRETFIKTYKYNIQGFVVGAAGFLVVAVGLRSLGVVPTEVVYLALGIEFILLLIYGVAMFYTVDDKPKDLDGTGKSSTRESMSVTLVALNQRLEQLAHHIQRAEAKMNPGDNKEFNEKFLTSSKAMTDHLALLESRLRMTEQKFDQLAKLNSSMDNLSSHLDLIVNDHLNSRVRREFETMIAQLTQRASQPKS